MKYLFILFFISINVQASEELGSVFFEDTGKRNPSVWYIDILIDDQLHLICQKNIDLRDYELYSSHVIENTKTDLDFIKDGEFIKEFSFNNNTKITTELATEILYSMRYHDQFKYTIYDDKTIIYQSDLHYTHALQNDNIEFPINEKNISDYFPYSIFILANLNGVLDWHSLISHKDIRHFSIECD